MLLNQYFTLFIQAMNHGYPWSLPDTVTWLERAFQLPRPKARRIARIVFYWLWFGYYPQRYIDGRF